VELRRRALEGDKEGTTRQNVQPGLLARIYEVQYVQSVKQRDPSKWRFQIQTSSRVTKAEPTSGGRILLNTTTSDGEDCTAVVDQIIAANGYERTEFEALFVPIKTAIDGAAISVNRDYEVNMRSNAVARGCGIWLQGSLTAGEDVSNPIELADGADITKIDDEMLPILAQRSGRVVRSIIEQRKRIESATVEEARLARL
jgi:lysine/ornithine N-monooxygenase